MRSVQLTPQLLSAIARCTQAAIRHAASIDDEPQANEAGTVGELLREQVELFRQDADLITGWLERIREAQS